VGRAPAPRRRRGRLARLVDVRRVHRLRTPRALRASRRMLLEGRRLLITGVLTEGSIAFAVARRAQEEGAQIVLTGFGRGLRITQRIAKRLGDPAPDVLEMDVNDPDQLAAVAADLEQRWGALDGVLHAIAFAPGDAL